MVVLRSIIIPDPFIEAGYGEVLQKREGIDEAEKLREWNNAEGQVEGFKVGGESVEWAERYWRLVVYLLGMSTTKSTTRVKVETQAPSSASAATIAWRHLMSNILV